MSLDVYLTVDDCPHCGRGGEEVYHANITHNLGQMAREAELYYPLWRPEDIGITTAGQLVESLTIGLVLLNENPEKFRAFNAPNGWGLYEHFVPFVEKYLEACKEHPAAKVGVWR